MTYFKSFFPKFLLLSTLILSSCHGQEQKALAEMEPSEQQYELLLGTWVAEESSPSKYDTLELMKNGDYSMRGEGFHESDHWEVQGVHKIKLGNDTYRFFFQKRNLILEDADGTQYSFWNIQRKFRKPTVVKVEQLGEQMSDNVVRRIFQDSRGDYWFGTNGKGVLHYDGNVLTKYSIDEGFGGWAVRGIVEDAQGNVWFATSGGVSKYNGKTFDNYTGVDGLPHSDVWSIAIDRKGTLWVGTLKGLAVLNGQVFFPFDLPESKPDNSRGVTSPWIVHSIMEDSQGKMWFGTNGGAYIYDGTTLSNLSEKDGLCHNTVNSILEDQHGHFWFATHHNGVCRWDGNTFTHFGSEDGIRNTEAWSLYEDRSGNIWFPIENDGVYRWDGTQFMAFHEAEGLGIAAIQSIYEDNNGLIWAGGWKGIYCFNGTSFYKPEK